MAIGIGIGIPFIRRRGDGGGFDVDYQAVLDRATALSYTLPSAGQQAKQNQLIIDLKASGVWVKLDVFYVYANDAGANFATINWKAPTLHQSTLVNSPSFGTNLGFLGNGSTSNINTNYNPLTNGTNFLLNSNHVMCYNLVNNSTGTLIGGNLGQNIEIAGNNSINRLTVLNNTTFGDNITIGANQQNGIYVNTRQISTSSILYKNGAAIITSARTSESIPNAQIRILSRSTLTNYSDARAAAASAGGGFNATEALNYSNSLTDYINSL
jgi:hypothetical protein